MIQSSASVAGTLRPHGDVARRTSVVHVGACLVAGCVVSLFVLGAQAQPLPTLVWAAAFLFLAIQQDVARLRIPNWLTGPGLLGALALSLLPGSTVGPGASLLGAVCALAVGFLPFAFGALGAGDVKGCMVLGALFGPADLAASGIWMLGFGGLMALLLLTLRGGLADLARRWLRSLALTARTGRVHYVGPNPGSPASSGIPFAVAMGLGVSAYQIWGTTWV